MPPQPTLRAAAALAALTFLLVAPPPAHAGGTEFPGGGTRSLGRGGAAFLRADDPSAMTRNPAALADLWDDQALLGAHLLLVDTCMQPTGAYGWNVAGADVSDFGEGPIYLQAAPGDRDLQGHPLQGYASEPFPKVCYQGPAPFLPQVGLSMKLTDELGVGIGFFPPDSAATGQWGNRDGTIETKHGLRPNPLRYYGSNLNVSFFSLLSAIGWRPADWISIGFGFQWTMLIVSATAWAEAGTTRNPNLDARADAFGRDLFVPGVIASVVVRPFDALDVGLGFKWSDRIQSSAKVDITTGAFGIGRAFQYMDESGATQHLEGTIPTRTDNVPGRLDAPPIWVPQATFSVRYADRLKPKPKDSRAAHAASGGVVEDSMATERWDIEADAVYYFNSAYDAVRFTNTGANVQVAVVNADGSVGTVSAPVGKCRVATTPCPDPTRITTTRYHGKDQLTLRAGGDYNVLPGILALRAGISYEPDGQPPQFFDVRNYMLSRTGIHAGVTLRVATKTDISLGFAHFFQREVHLQVNDLHTAAGYPREYKTPEYHFKPGLGVADASGMNGASKNGFDGVAGVELPNGDPRTDPGPDFINAGSYYYNLDVVSVSFTQHF